MGKVIGSRYFPSVAVFGIILMMLIFSRQDHRAETVVVPKDDSPREAAPAVKHLYPDPIRAAIYSRPRRDAQAAEQCKPGTAILPTGAWCLASRNPKRYFAPGHELSEQHIAVPEGVAQRLMGLFKDSDVVDLGAGLGQFGHYFETKNRGGRYMAFDGALNVETFTGGLVFHADLTEPLYFPADWVLSLEVGEHIPKQYEQAYVSNLVQNAKVGLVLSWAVPRQGGHGHVNERPNDAVISQMSTLGFEYMSEESMELRKAAPGTHYWLRNTMMAFKRVRDMPENVWP